MRGNSIRTLQCSYFCFYTHKPVSTPSTSKDIATSIFHADSCIQVSHTTSSKSNQILTVQTDFSSSLSHNSIFSHSNIPRPYPSIETQLPRHTTITSVPTSSLSYPFTSSDDRVQHFYSNSKFQNSINGVLSSWPIQSLISCDHNDSVPQTFVSENKIQVLLENKEMWEKFDWAGNEMILSRTGRRMFPSVKVRVSGLEPTKYYFVLLDIVPKDNHRYTYSGRQWLARGPADLPVTPQLYIHPDCPASGSQLMKQSVSFHKVKLTNNFLQHEGHIYLNSMHKYIPRVHIVAGSDILKIPHTYFNTFSFPETTFVAVTAYQNEQVVKLKVDNNPFAKNFRFKRCAKTQLDSKFEEERSGVPLEKKTKLENFEVLSNSGFEPEDYQSGMMKTPCPVIPMNFKLSVQGSLSSPDSRLNKIKSGSFVSGLQNSLTSLNISTETGLRLHSPPSSIEIRAETTRLRDCRNNSTDILLPSMVEMTSPLIAANHYRQLLMSLPIEKNDYFSLSFNPHISQFFTPFNSAVMTSHLGLKPLSVPAFSGP
ncbi:T-box transcription factor TBX2-A-like isoform X2 [Limulus polyphemus]|uniref:T-box transcription factor TBX2-A-like isoform X2 n=1 Tax=Limulus polyphemus TaxID=6850 RepID=A0ABM1T481_LIMPO|nr:T-box transcription factor TBX2-A-like isoform X2 [Limulus polyphemus]